MNKKVIFTDRSDSLLTSYLKDISKYKILESSEVIRLVGEAQAGSAKAREEIIKSNLRFVVTVAKQFQNRGIPLMDLISSGNEGLNNIGLNRLIILPNYVIIIFYYGLYRNVSIIEHR